MLVFASSDHRQHHALEVDGGRLIPSWECPERIDSIEAALVGPHAFRPPAPLDHALVASIHDAGYLEFLASVWNRWVAAGEQGEAAMALCWPTRGMDQERVPTSVRGQLGFYSFAVDCSVTPGTWAAVCTSAALAQSAADAVVEGERVAFALCRPPGHHATSSQFGGYCYLNNAAVAAQRLLDHGRTRVAIVDVDYHHGNGTQDIFYRRDDVLYCSVHADPTHHFPYYLGHADERGDGEGVGFNHNEPMPLDTGFADWSAALDRCLERVVATGCEALVVSLGVDTFEGDPISHFRLAGSDFVAMGRRLAAAELPTVFVMEGGYAVGDLGRNVANVLDGFEAVTTG
ncbi:MAG: histone deacetylase family protein [Actinomycetota bacterium]|nr:histone deacetylase family protein [Actinomycetota bacterium]